MPSFAFMFFADGIPPMRLEGDLIHIGPGPLGNVGTMRVHDARVALERLAALIREFDNLPDPVIPLCELCVRRNLPRLGSD